MFYYLLNSGRAYGCMIYHVSKEILWTLQINVSSNACRGNVSLSEALIHFRWTLIERFTFAIKAWSLQTSIRLKVEMLHELKHTYTVCLKDKKSHSNHHRICYRTWQPFHIQMPTKTTGTAHKAAKQPASCITISKNGPPIT